MPTVQGTDDFNHAIDNAFYDLVFGSPSSVTSPLYALQPRSLLVPSVGANVGVRKNITGTPTRGWAAFPFRYAGVPTGGDVVICSFHSVSDVSARLNLGSTNNLYATLSDQIGASTTLAPDTWYWIEAIFDVSGATNALHFRVEGVNGASASKALSASTVDYSQLLSFAGNGSLSWYAGMWKWGSAASASDWLGEPAAGTEIDADFIVPYEIQGVTIASTLGALPSTTSIQVVHEKTRAPLSSDDIADGYGPGDVWIYGGIAWWCVSAAVNAAVWKQVTA